MVASCLKLESVEVNAVDGDRQGCGGVMRPGDCSKIPVDYIHISHHTRKREESVSHMENFRRTKTECDNFEAVSFYREKDTFELSRFDTQVGLSQCPQSDNISWNGDVKTRSLLSRFMSTTQAPGLFVAPDITAE